MKIEPKVVPYWDVNAISNIKNEKDVAKQFEATFLKIMMKELRKGVPEGLFSSFADKFYLDMFDMAVADKLASSDKLGLADYVEKAMKAYKKTEDI